MEKENEVLVQPTETNLAQHKVVSKDEWNKILEEHIKKEKKMMKLRDELSKELRSLPWVKVEKNYVFDGPYGKTSLSDLFAGRSQLIVKHFMMGPGWAEGCVGCSFTSDHIGGVLPHLENHDVSYVAVSRAPMQEIEAFKRRMGWDFRWVSSFDSDFNYDFNVSFTPEQIAEGNMYYNFAYINAPMEELSGFSIFYKDEKGDIYRTYSVYGRGEELALTTYAFLDLTPKGRNEQGGRANLTNWVRHHDRYNAGGYVDDTGRYHANEKKSSDGSCCH
jgi:predicted dithiol-disulfide oxidoreductase (DUF899 family)